MKGRKPVPTKLKILRGNPGRRRLNKNEPKHSTSAPPMPDGLDAHAAEEWQRLVPLLEEAGLLTKVDRSTLAAYCVAWSRWREAEEKLKDFGLVLKGEGGFYQNPYLSIVNKCMDQLIRFSTLLGLDPSSRTRLHATPAAGEPDDPLLKLLNG